MRPPGGDRPARQGHRPDDDRQCREYRDAGESFAEVLGRAYGYAVPPGGNSRAGTSARGPHGPGHVRVEQRIAQFSTLRLRRSVARRPPLPRCPPHLVGHPAGPAVGRSGLRGRLWTRLSVLRVGGRGVDGAAFLQGPPRIGPRGRPQRLCRRFAEAALGLGEVQFLLPPMGPIALQSRRRPGHLAARSQTAVSRRRSSGGSGPGQCQPHSAHHHHRAYAFGSQQYVLAGDVHESADCGRAQGRPVWRYARTQGLRQHQPARSAAFFHV